MRKGTHRLNVRPANFVMDNTMPEISFVKAALPKAGAVVVLMAEGGEPSALHLALDAASGGAVARGLEAAGFKGSKGQSATIWAPAPGITKLVAVGMGPAAALTPDSAEAVGGAAYPLIRAEKDVLLAADGIEMPVALRVALGVKLRSYRFDLYRTTQKPDDLPKLARLAVALAEPTAARAAYAPFRAVAEGVFLSRDLVSEPPNVLHPVEMAERCRGLEALGVIVEILGLKDKADRTKAQTNIEKAVFIIKK
jgi:leucyl aminopeptidase